MKQFLFTDRFLPHKGGSRVYYYEVCQRLKIPVLTSREAGATEFDPSQNFKIYRHRGIRTDSNGMFHPKNPLLNIMINYIPPLISMVFWGFVYTLKFKPEVIHAGGVQFAGFAALVMRKLFGIPFIVYAHGEEIQASQQQRYLSIYVKWLFNCANQVVANSEFTKSLLLSIGVPHHKIQIVIPGISETYFEPPVELKQVCEKYNLAEKRVILSVGRLTKRKGHTQVLNVLDQLVEKIPNLCYVVVGKGSEYGNLKKLVSEKKLTNYVQFTGEIDNQELHCLYHLCDIFVLANRLLRYDVEGFGMVFLEAGAAAKPVIGGRSGGTVDAVQDGITGFLVNPENPSEIVDKINYFLDNPFVSQQMGVAGKNWAKLFLWSKQIEKIDLLVKQLVRPQTQQL